MPAEPFDDSTPDDYICYCKLCYKQCDCQYEFCSKNCEEIHGSRLRELRIMAEQKYTLGYITAILWSDDDFEYIIVYGDNRSALIGDFHEARQFLEV
jgi:hypothetical protein